MDISFNNIFTPQGDYYVSIEENPQMAQGNKLVVNIFEITFMTNLNDSLMSYGYGGNGTNTVKTGYNPNDLQSIASVMKVACDDVVLMMKADQEFLSGVPNIEKIAAAYVDNVSKEYDRVKVKIRIIPVEYEPQYAEPGLTLTLPL